MCLLHVEVGITIVECDGVRLIDIRVEVRDAGTADAHVVGEAEVAALGDGVLQAGAGHEAAVAGAEVMAIAEVILHVLPGVLIAYARLHAHLVEVAHIFAIAGEDLVLILVVAAGGGIVDTLEVILRVGGGIMELQLSTEVQRLSDGEGHGVVELEGVVGGLVIVLRVAAREVGQPHAPRATEGVCGLSGGRTVVQLVGECQRLCVLLVEEALVVDASAEGGARVLHVGTAVVAEVCDIVAPHLRGGGARALHRHRVHLCRGVEHAHLTELVAQGEAPHGERGLHVAGRGHDLRDTIVLNLLQFGRGVTRFVVAGHGVDTIGELPLLAADEGTPAKLLGACRGADRAVVTVHAIALRGHAPGSRHLLVHHDVEHARGSLGIVLRTRVGHHLDALHGRGRHALEHH